MFGWFTLLFKFFDPIAAIGKQIADYKLKMADVETERERIETQENITALQAKRDVMVAESKTPINSIARALLMLPFAIIVWEYVVYDHIMCKWFHAATDVAAVCSTDDLSKNLWDLCKIVYGFYFLDQLARRFSK